MLSLLQREAEMQRPTSQIMKGPMKNKKKRLVIAEICCSQEIKGANHGTCNKHLFCVDIKALKPLEYEEMTKMLSSPPSWASPARMQPWQRWNPAVRPSCNFPPPSRARLGHRRVNPLARPCQGWAFGAKGALVEAERESDALNALSVLPGTGGAGAAKHPWPLGRAAARRRGRFPWLSARPRRSPRPAIKRRGARSARSAAPTGPPRVPRAVSLPRGAAVLPAAMPGWRKSLALCLQRMQEDGESRLGEGELRDALVLLLRLLLLLALFWRRRGGFLWAWARSSTSVEGGSLNAVKLRCSPSVLLSLAGGEVWRSVSLLFLWAVGESPSAAGRPVTRFCWGHSELQLSRASGAAAFSWWFFPASNSKMGIRGFANCTEDAWR